MNKIFILISLLLCLTNSAFADWKSTFYTDDSSYYLKLKKNGFRIRFRVSKNDCSAIKSAKVLFKHEKLHIEGSHFNKVSPNQIKRNWPSLYGIQISDYCWFESDVTGINLNEVEENKYVIALNTRYSQMPYFFQGLNQSLLPSKRLTNTDITKWISLGGHGSFLVEGGGVFYKIWEPYADQVDLFINNSSSPIKMIADYDHSDIRRSHSIYVSNSRDKSLYSYKFIKNGSYEVVSTSNLGARSAIKVDPMARELTYKDKGGKLNGYKTPLGVVKNNSKYNFRYDRMIYSLPKKQMNNWIIYQLWPATFNPPASGHRSGTFKDVEKKLNYLEELGINTIEFLPVHESRFHVSWGYALDSLLLIENNLGKPEELKQLVDKIHSKKIKVIFDVVLNHINNTLLRDPLSASRNTSKFYNGDTGWGPRPNFSSIMVRKWMMDSLLALKREYHVDGYRFDMIEHIYKNSRAGYEFLQEVNILLKLDSNSFYTSAEQLPDNVWATYPIYENGLGFDSQWNDNFKNAFEDGFSHYNKNNMRIETNHLISALRGYSDHKNSSGGLYHFGAPSRTLNYIGSHDFVGNKDPIIRLVSGLRSYEHDHHNKFFRVKPLSGPSARVNFRTVHNTFTHSVGKLAYTLLFTKPGALLFYQGEEFANDRNIENEWSYVNARKGNSIPSKNVELTKYIKSHRTPWEHLTPGSGELSFLSKEESHSLKGYHHYFKQLIYLKSNMPEINHSDIEDIKTYHDASVIRYLLNAGKYKFLVVINTGTDKDGVWIDFPFKGKWWKEILNSSEVQYGGIDNKHTNIIPLQGGRSNLLRLKSASATIFMIKDNPPIKETLYLRGTFNNWAASSTTALVKGRSNKQPYTSQLNIKSSGTYKFKLGTQNWDVSIGGNANSAVSGSLSYKTKSNDVIVRLEKGRYQFLFDLSTFKYKFIKK